MSINHLHTAAVVVWYHPTNLHAAHIREYAPAIKQVYIVDNSEEDHSSLAEGIANAIYLPNGTNKGIATALNVGYEQAVKDGMEWIIAFDQDSCISASLLTDFMHLCESCDIPDVGIFAPYPYYGNDLPDEDVTFEKRDFVITSGTLMSAQTYLQAGRFRDDLFIDLVDEEYCLRLKRLGKEIVMVNRIVMEHSLGNGMVTTPLLHHRFVEHNALRHYYIVRNTLVMMADYPEARTHYRKLLLKRIKRLCLYDRHDKWQKLKMCCRAYYDYRNHVMGPLKND
jgi:rhamnosyltransferase